MKYEPLKILLAGLRVTALTAVVILSTHFIVAFKAQSLYADLWQQLGISRENGTDNIKRSFLYGRFHYWGARNLKQLINGDKATVAKELLAYTRQYVQGDAFKKEYAAYRMQVKPAPPKAASTEDEIRKKYIEDTKRSIAETEKALKTATGDLKKIFQESLAMLQKQLKEYEDPNNEMIKLVVQSEQQRYEMQTSEYQESMKKWEETLPEDYRGMIRQRLQNLLDATANVDYAAQLTERNGKKYFVKPEYERKPANWKMAFRAGREVTETVRAFAEQWLKELN